MSYEGEVRKMLTSLNEDGSVNYEFILVDSKSAEKLIFSANDFIGKTIELSFNGTIICKSCGKKTNKSFHQGFCYPCFRDAPEAAECIIKPELCRAHLGEGRDPEWEEKHHNQPHIVYLAASDVVKVGVTRTTQIPTRWIDQGANEAIRLAETPNRYLAGMLEVALKEQFTDRTNWRKMLKNEVDESIDLEETKWELEEMLPDDMSQYITEDDEMISINYPVDEYPSKVKSLSFDKTPTIQGELKGIKGQYLLLDNNRVLNMRKHTSYVIHISE
jgi:hypothetical protein